MGREGLQKRSTHRTKKSKLVGTNRQVRNEKISLNIRNVTLGKMHNLVLADTFGTKCQAWKPPRHGHVRNLEGTE